MNQLLAGVTRGVSCATSRDPNREDYMVHEGNTLCITQQNRSDLFVRIPVRMRTPIDATLNLQLLLPHY